MFLPKLFERFCFVRAICNVNKHPPAPKGGGGAIINVVNLLKFDKVCGAKGGRWCNRASIKIKSAGF